jgi:hypothetical protein
MDGRERSGRVESFGDDARLKGMRTLATFIPHSASTSPISARQWAVAASAAACGSCAFAGLYPPFDGGTLAMLIGLTTAVLAGVLVRIALEVKGSGSAMFSAFGLAMLFGWLNTVLPAFVLGFTGGGSQMLGPALVFGVVFGVPTGLAYGIPLGVLVGLVHESAHGTSLDAADRGKVRASIWCGVLALLAFVLGFARDAIVPTVIAALMMLASIFGAVFHTGRIRARRAWTERVRAGLEPMLHVRELSPADPPGLPRFGDGRSVVVVDWTPSAGEGVYRSAAGGVPLVVLADSDRA